MEKSNFWNDAARCGAILGAVLAFSAIVENKLMLSGSVTLYTLLTVEYLAFAALHYYLLHRFTRLRSELSDAGEGFSFGQGYRYLLAVSAFAGIIVGAVQYIHLHLVIGYSEYIDRYVAALTSVLAQTGGAVSSSMEGVVSQLVGQLGAAAEPSVIATVWGGVLQSLIFGGIFGVIIAGVLSRPSKPFGTAGEE